MLAKYFSIIRHYVLSVSSQRKYNFYHQNKLLAAFLMNSRNIIGRNPSIEISLLANQDLTPMLICTFFIRNLMIRNELQTGQKVKKLWYFIQEKLRNSTISICLKRVN